METKKLRNIYVYTGQKNMHVYKFKDLPLLHLFVP